MRKTFADLEAAFKRVEAACDKHPVPAPAPGSSIIPRACTCYMRTNEALAYFGWRSPVCNICGGGRKCKRNCTATDAIR